MSNMLSEVNLTLEGMPKTKINKREIIENLQEIKEVVYSDVDDILFFTEFLEYFIEKETFEDMVKLIVKEMLLQFKDEIVLQITTKEDMKLVFYIRYSDLIDYQLLAILQKIKEI